MTLGCRVFSRDAGGAFWTVGHRNSFEAVLWRDSLDSALYSALLFMLAYLTSEMKLV